MKPIRPTNQSLLFIAGLFLLSYASCKGDLDLFGDPSKNTSPQVTMVSVSQVDDESVLLKGEVTSKGKATAEYAGFCFGTMASPLLTDNQLISGSGSGEFT